MKLSASEMSTVISDEIPGAFVAEDELQSKNGKTVGQMGINLITGLKSII